MGRFLCFPVNYNCLISFWKIQAEGGGLRGGGGWGVEGELAEALVSIVKGAAVGCPIQ